MIDGHCGAHAISRCRPGLNQIHLSVRQDWPLTCSRQKQVCPMLSGTHPRPPVVVIKQWDGLALLLRASCFCRGLRAHVGSTGSRSACEKEKKKRRHDLFETPDLIPRSDLQASEETNPKDGPQGQTCLDQVLRIWQSLGNASSPRDHSTDAPRDGRFTTSETVDTTGWEQRSYVHYHDSRLDRIRHLAPQLHPERLSRLTTTTSMC